jgi:hypothetical protein
MVIVDETSIGDTPFLRDKLTGLTPINAPDGATFCIQRYRWSPDPKKSYNPGTMMTRIIVHAGHERWHERWPK